MLSYGGHLGLGKEGACLKFMLGNSVGQGQMLIVLLCPCVDVCAVVRGPNDSTASVAVRIFYRVGGLGKEIRAENFLVCVCVCAGACVCVCGCVWH